MRTIKKIIPAPQVNMGGHLLEQPLPYQEIDQIDPFLLIHHWKNEMPGGQKEHEVGVGPHPHRGFSPVTVVYAGAVHHRDSIGNSEVIGEGGTQWMNSGKGIIHSERPPKDLAQQGGLFEFIQFWVNTPKSNKLDAPKYQSLTKETTPIVDTDDQSELSLVAGEYKGAVGNLEVHSPMLIMRATIKSKGKLTLQIPTNFNALIYQLDGHAQINGSISRAKDMVWFENDHEDVQIETTEETRFLILSGEPINEPLATYGPFVMNSQQELQEAIYAYQAGEMGTLNENFKF